jgi:hypothetical protein
VQPFVLLAKYPQIFKNDGSVVAGPRITADATTTPSFAVYSEAGGKGGAIGNNATAADADVDAIDQLPPSTDRAMLWHYCQLVRDLSDGGPSRLSELGRHSSLGKHMVPLSPLAIACGHDKVPVAVPGIRTGRYSVLEHAVGETPIAYPHAGAHATDGTSLKIPFNNRLMRSGYGYGVQGHQTAVTNPHIEDTARVDLSGRAIYAAVGLLHSDVPRGSPAARTASGNIRGGWFSDPRGYHVGLHDAPRVDGMLADPASALPARVDAAGAAVQNVVLELGSSAGKFLQENSPRRLFATAYGAATDFAGVPGYVAKFDQLVEAAKVLQPDDQFILRFLGALRFERGTLSTLSRLNIIAPVSAIAMNAHMEYETVDCIKMKAGSETGNMWVKRGNFVIGLDAKNQELVGSMNYGSAAVVKEPLNVAVVADRYVSGVRGGGGFIPIPAPTTLDPNGGTYNPSLGQDGGGETEPAMEGRPSTYYFMEPYWSVNSREFANPLSLHGSLMWTHGNTAMPITKANANAFASLPYYTERYRFKHKVLPSQDPFAEAFISDVINANAVAWEARTERWDHNTKQMGVSNTTAGTGHWAKSGAYVGVKAERAGRRTRLHRQAYQHSTQ